MRFKDADKEDIFRKRALASTDPFDKPIYSFIERWANLMEERMRFYPCKTAEEVIFEYAAMTANTADTELLSAMQRGCATNILCSIWQYGDILARWRSNPYLDYKMSRAELDWKMEHWKGG